MERRLAFRGRVGDDPAGVNGGNRALFVAASRAADRRGQSSPRRQERDSVDGTLQGLESARKRWYHDVMLTIEASFEKGLLRPTTPLKLRPGERVSLIVVRRPDPSRWNLDRLARSSTDEDLALAEEDLGAWADALDAEDRA